MDTVCPLIIHNTCFFVAAYLTGWLLDRTFSRESKENRCGGWWESKFKHLVLTLCFYFLSIVVVYSRVHLGVHTAEQVIVGCLVGWILGISWHFFGKLFIRPYWFPFFAKTTLARLLYLKDSQFIDNVLLFEFTNTYAKVFQNHIMGEQDNARKKNTNGSNSPNKKNINKSNSATRNHRKRKKAQKK